MASDTANATVHVCPEGGELAGQVMPQRRNSESRRSRDDGREPRKYGTPEQIARRSISEAGAAGAWMTAPGEEEAGEEAPPAAAPAAAASSLMAIADDDARRFSLTHNPLAA